MFLDLIVWCTDGDSAARMAVLSGLWDGMVVWGGCGDLGGFWGGNVCMGFCLE